jgi:hypothetical protein
MRYKLLIAAALSLSSACAPQFGDNCSTTTECSVAGDRYCDLAQPGGYCTQINCEPKSCGGDGVCVLFNPGQPRLSSSWCMAKCGGNGDCRDKYVCRSAKQLGSADPSVPGQEPPITEDQTCGPLDLACVVDSKKTQKFCVVEE